MGLQKDSKIYIAGHKGMVGSACWLTLEHAGYTNLIGRNSTELDLRDQAAVNTFIVNEKPEAIILAAAKVGGILANDREPYEFLMYNMQIQNNIIDAAHHNNIPKLVFLGSSCIYPKHSPQPLLEKYLLTAPLEPTNQWYAVAKIAGVKLIEALRKQYQRDYVSLMPTNLYGLNDNYNLETSHVLPAMIRKFHEAKQNSISHVVLWGSGTPFREFLYAEDLAKAVLFALENRLPDSLYNVGSSEEISIKDLAFLVKDVVGFSGEIEWDTSKPDGTPRKLMDSSKLNAMGWHKSISLKEGITNVYKEAKNTL